MSQRYIGGLIYNPPGGWCGQFGATSTDYISTASSSAFAFGTGDFTMEAFVLANTSQTDNWIIGLYNNCWLRIGSGGVLEFYNSVASSSVAATSAMPINQWVHVAAVRSGTTLTIYQNGVAVASGTVSTNFSTSVACVVGNQGSGFDRRWNGYISNARVVKGTAVYTSAFTPPNGPLQAITNTSLLTCRYPTFVDGSSNNFTLTVSGSASVNAANPFPQTQLPTPALGNQGNGVYSMSQYQALRSQNLWPAIDPYFDYVTLMLHGNGTNGAQNNTFLDSSTNNFTITRNGNTTQGTFTPYGANWSNFFDGNGDYLSAASNAAFAPGTGDFTIECWVNLSSIGTYNGFFQNTNSTTAASTDKFFFAQYNNLLVLYTHNGGSAAASAPWSPSIGVWYHVAAVRQSGTIKLFINGVQQTVTGSTTFNGYSLGQAGISIGMTTTPFYFNGYISNLRYVVGTAVYTASFTLPTAPVTAVTNTQILTCQSNRFIDNSGNAYTITANGDTSVQRFSPFNPTTPYAADVIGGSGYFDGSGDYLTSAASSALDLSTGDWTIQGWYYPTAYSAGNNVLAYVGASSGDKIVIADISTGGNGLWYLLNGSAAITSSTKAPLNAWSFFALVKSGSTTTLYLNGVSLGTTTSVPTSSNKSLNLGSDAGGAPYQGYMADFRILKGTANTAVPTAPLTNITNTSLLLNFTNGGIIDNAMMNDLETVGNAQISTSVSKFGGGSLAFDGSGDYLLPSSAGTNNPLALGSGDFTLEFWLNFAALGDVTVIDWRPTSTNGAYPTLYMDVGTNKIIYYANSANRITSSTVFTTGTWYHIAVVRSSGATKLYINGNNEGSTYSDSTNYLAAAVRPVIGANGAGNGTNAINGYLDDLRITKGYARYTANFTPQRSQWQDQ